MTDLKRHSQRVWDRFFELLSSCNESATDAEIDADFKRFGIKMESANRKLHRMVAQHRARSQFVAAKSNRVAVIDRLRNVVAPRVDNIRASINDLIDRAVSVPSRSAYFHKLEKAASEQDLQSLLDDLQKLDAFTEHDEPPAQ
jgi:hypothetical protein